MLFAAPAAPAAVLGALQWQRANRAEPVPAADAASPPPPAPRPPPRAAAASSGRQQPPAAEMTLRLLEEDQQTAAWKETRFAAGVCGGGGDGRVWRIMMV